MVFIIHRKIIINFTLGSFFSALGQIRAGRDADTLFNIIIKIE
jgi:hypothetical protein